MDERNGVKTAHPHQARVKKSVWGRGRSHSDSNSVKTHPVDIRRAYAMPRDEDVAGVGPSDPEAA